ncbi:ABC transporter family substrate-binding protein [Streptomyces rectiverticillatus]|uniref:ABC transporter substrate-binding protein n=1 Tax=Streptomyces rectiverticillatus TaxID=173860 RepID=UPI0015C2F35B|nr:ABC transporter substrate-binding protein [Streptomyces rectiverticillatus]QLE73762.1 ABC transporter family substrate-binding protein [Streptomyces rectiverticillatus]
MAFNRSLRSLRSLWSPRPPRSLRTLPSLRSRTRRRRCAALLTAGILLTGCGLDQDGDGVVTPQDVAAAPRAKVADGGTLTWAVDTLPSTLNTFQTDADATTQRVAAAVLPALFTTDGRGRPQRNADYLRSAEVAQREPHQVVVYKLNPKAVWSDGKALTAADFEAQWKALRGKDSAYWTARNAGYDRIDRVEQGADAHEVKVTFARSCADWPALFTPLYPKAVMSSADGFNDGARNELKLSAGPFRVAGRDNKQGTLTLARDPKWWGDPAKLDRLVLRTVPRAERAAALAAGKLDLADVTAADARRITDANKPKKQDKGDKPPAAAAPRSPALRGVVVRKSLEPGYTQLALNGAAGPLADERVRRAVARAIDRRAVAKSVLGPLGLPTEPLGSHLFLAGQDGYEDNSDAIGGPDPKAARALLAEAGWKQGRADGSRTAAGADGADDRSGTPGRTVELRPGPRAGPDPADGDETEGTAEDFADLHDLEDGAAGADSVDGADEAGLPDGDGKRTARDGGGKAAAAPVRMKNGKKLTLRFVVPVSAGTESLRSVADHIARRLDAVGIATEMTKVGDVGFFKDHIAAGSYDLALYSWPATAFPATDARPLFAKPQPAADGSLVVEQNYTRVGTDRIDQLFDQASTELDAEASRDLAGRADARIWALAGSIPLYQRPQLVGARKTVANAGAFGLGSPRYQDIGFRRG